MTGDNNQGLKIFGLILDRTAAFSIGLTVGVVLGISFFTEGKPFEAVFDAAQPAPKAKSAPKPGTAPIACSNDFPMAPRVAAALKDKRPIRIGVFGDSFGDGIWAGTLQELSGRKDFEVYQFSKVSTGLTRYRTLDILADTQDKVKKQPIDIALISFGANDTQGVWANGKAAAYMSDAWQEIIGGRARDIVRYLQKQGTAVAWVGLPRMRKASYDDQIQQMNGFYDRLTCDLGIAFINPVAVTQDARQKFSIDLIDPETAKKYRARADDGIHMTIRGYRVIVRPLTKKILRLRPAEQAAPPPAAAAAPVKAAQ